MYEARRSGIQADIAASLRAASAAKLKPGLASIKAGEKAAPNAELLQMIGRLSDLLARIDRMTEPTQVDK